ncbi:MAG: OmpA family protein [Polyangiaceae bacterium]|nr:OmpA family protein [Polyangiaceae bacterium]MCW5789344.1 OmpA family protein [Polyangiaceae bacterium]
MDHQLTAHLGMSLALFERLLLDVNLPATLSQGGQSPSEAPSLAAPEEATLNDVRLGAQLRVLDGPIAAALGVRVWAPTGDDGAYTSTGEVRYEPYVTVGGRLDSIQFAAHVGRKRQPAGSGLQHTAGSELISTAGVWWVGERWSAGPELALATAANGRTRAFSEIGTAAELLLGGRYEIIPDLRAGAAFGPGLGRALGTPQYRALLNVTWTPGRAEDERRKEEARRAAELAGDAPDAEPPTHPALAAVADDRDLDGVLDAEDACPDTPGEREPQGAKPGCPPDRDQDGVEDALDACPDTPGVANLDPKLNGCPLDTDGDGIIDSEDACPGEAGPKHEDPKLHGCPPSVRVEGKQIVILEQVRFATGSHVILPESFPLLKQVADVLQGHPDIARVAVDGHTDNVGQLNKNLTLSRQRAAAVLRHLVEQGVDERRLEARGFGPRRPIEPNTTAEGRAKNRRVEFQILKRTPLGERGWHDGGAEDAKSDE